MSKSKLYRSILLVMIVCTTVTIWIYKIMNEKVPYVDQLTRGGVDLVASTKIYDVARFITNFGSESFLIPFTVVIGLVIWFLYKDWLPMLVIWGGTLGDRKSTRLNSSHVAISYAVFCLKKKNNSESKRK